MEIAALSPDGRYLVEDFGLHSLLASDTTPPPSPQARAASGWGQAPLIPIRDAGLQAALALVQTNAFSSTYLTGIEMAWRPDGRVLAVESQNPQHSVRLFSCATGTSVGTLIPATKGGVSSHEDGESNILRWSPDGSRLLLFDTQLGTVTIWSVARAG